MARNAVGRPAVPKGAVFGLMAAAMFGISTPLAKQLLGDVRPQMLAGLLYAGAAVAISGAMAVRGGGGEARLRRGDAPTLGAITLTGGIVAPVLLLIGLERVSGVAGSLLLNLEAVLTLVLALAVFGENLDRRAGYGSAAVVVAAAVLGLGGGRSEAQWLGIACVATACLFWAIDNNLTQRLSGRDPFAIVRTKTLVAGVTNLAIASLLGDAWPAPRIVVATLLLGGFAYGASVVLDAYALRFVGAAREAAYFGTAPAFGVAGSLLILGEVLSAAEAVAVVVMGVGVYLLVTEGHGHRHVHAPLEHDHRHRHDDGHHDHEHDHAEPVDEHSHPHVHESVGHTHPHVSDAHHRHRHGSS